MTPPPPSRRPRRAASAVPVDPRPPRRPARVSSPGDEATPPVEEVKVQGVNACRALFLHRSSDIIRVYLVEERLKVMARLLHWCAAEKKAYHVVSEEELGKVAGGLHHEGVCILARQKPTLDVPQLLERVVPAGRPVCLLALEDVQNPHNLGAILRVAAHFGVPAVLCLGTTPHTFSGAVFRTAEGAAEHVQLVHVPDAAAGLGALRGAGFRVLATSHRGDLPLYGAQLPQRLVLLLGSEGSGLSASVLALAEGALQVAGTGRVESLNVACASTALLGEYWRQHPSTTP